MSLRNSQRAVRKQFTVLISKIFKVTKAEKTHFVIEVDVLNKNVYLVEVVTQMGFAKKRIKIFGTTHKKTPVRSLSLACRSETLLKKRLLHRCFPIKFIRAFLKNTYEQFDNFDLI